MTQDRATLIQNCCDAFADIRNARQLGLNGTIIAIGRAEEALSALILDADTSEPEANELIAQLASFKALGTEMRKIS
jgi:hypothetical protein